MNRDSFTLVALLAALGFPSTLRADWKTELRAFLDRNQEEELRIAVVGSGLDPLRERESTRALIDAYDASAYGSANTAPPLVRKDGALVGRSGRVLQLGDDLLERHRVSADVRVAGIREKDFVSRRAWESEFTERKSKWRAANQLARARIEAALEVERDPAMRAELEERLAQLAALDAEFDEDAGAYFDVVVYREDASGETDRRWLVRVDTDEDGNLAEESPMASWPAEGSLASLRGGRLPFAVRVDEDGERVRFLADLGEASTRLVEAVEQLVSGRPAARRPSLHWLSVRVQPGAWLESSLLEGSTDSMWFLAAQRTVEARCDLILVDSSVETICENFRHGGKLGDPAGVPIILRDPRTRFRPLWQVPDSTEKEAEKPAVPEAAVEPELPDEAFISLRLVESLDTLQHRKRFLRRIVEECGHVLRAIDGRDDEASRRLRIDLLYRRGRALAYQELSDVVARQPIDDVQALDRAFEENFAQLAGLVDTTSRQFFLLHVRRERRKGRFAMALRLLDRHRREGPWTWLWEKKRRDLLGELGWEHARRRAALELALAQPDRAAE